MRRTAVLLGFLALVPVGPVLAQTTTSSTSTTSTSTTTIASAPTTTTTTPPVATADADPPTAFLTGASGEVRGEPGSSCWTPPGGRTGRCVDRAGTPTGPTLDVARGETLTLRFTTGLALTELSIRAGGVEVAPPAANPSRFRADLPPGTYRLLVSARFSAGDASYGFGLRVIAPATAPPAVPTVATGISLTG